MRPGSKPAFGVARPMKGGSAKPEEDKGGEQFPPLPTDEPAAEKAKPAPAPAPSSKGNGQDAMDRRHDIERLIGVCAQCVGIHRHQSFEPSRPFADVAMCRDEPGDFGLHFGEALLNLDEQYLLFLVEMVE